MSTKHQYQQALTIATDALKDIALGFGASSADELIDQMQEVAEKALRDIHPLVPEISEYEIALEQEVAL